MKVMHNPPLDVRVKVEKHLEKNGKWLVNFAYGSNDVDERRLYVGIAYMPVNDNTVDCYSSKRYDVVIYDNDEDNFRYYSKDVTYDYALMRMGEYIN